VAIGIVILLIAAFFLVKNPGSQNQDTTNGSATNETPQENLASESAKISLGELSKHSKKEDCWLAIEGKVYDVTQFIPNHPGKEAILMGCGKDASSLFRNRPNGSGSHSALAESYLPNFEIGDLE
jgi:cytochrome b involved in lipid metabolism